MQPLEILRFTLRSVRGKHLRRSWSFRRRAMIVDPGIGSEPVWDVVCDR
jgi:hypothetical protein